MEEIKHKINELLEGVKGDKYKEYEDDWREQAVSVINEYYYEVENYDDIIYDLSSDEWDDIVKREAENGWVRLKFFLAGIETTSDWAYIDAYGNAQACDYDIKGTLEDIKKEIEDNEN